MDPSKLQTDPDNDADSLEKDAGNGQPAGEQNAGQTAPGKDGVIDATGEAAESKPAAGESLLKKAWHKFNLFLLLFVMLVVLCVGTLITLVVKDSTANAPKDNVASQDLSDSSLTELANNTVTVGEPQHVLNVNSHAIFNGSVLVRGDIEVAGAIKVGESVELASITVAGLSRFAQLQTDDLEVNGTASVQGPFTARSGIQVSGNSTFDGSVSAASIAVDSLQLRGDLGVTAHIVVSGSTPSLSKGPALGGGGTASVNGTDTAGSITINTGGSPPAGCFATIGFKKAFSRTPHVIITPVGSAAGPVDYYVNRSTGNFSVCTSNPAPAGQNFGFDYWVSG